MYANMQRVLWSETWVWEEIQHDAGTLNNRLHKFDLLMNNIPIWKKANWRCDTNMSSGIWPRISKSLSPLYQVIKKTKQSHSFLWQGKTTNRKYLVNSCPWIKHHKASQCTYQSVCVVKLREHKGERDMKGIWKREQLPTVSHREVTYNQPSLFPISLKWSKVTALRQVKRRKGDVSHKGPWGARLPSYTAHYRANRFISRSVTASHI